ncbi:hypothetical protein QTP88_002847 [Uroleucon formosanum]
MPHGTSYKSFWSISPYTYIRRKRIDIYCRFCCGVEAAVFEAISGCLFVRKPRRQSSARKISARHSAASFAAVAEENRRPPVEKVIRSGTGYGRWRAGMNHARAARDVTVGPVRQPSDRALRPALPPSLSARVVDTRQSVMAVSASVVFVLFKGSVATNAAAATAAADAASDTHCVAVVVG